MTSDETPAWQRLREPDKISAVQVIAEALQRARGGEQNVKRVALEQAAARLDLQMGTGNLEDLWDAAFQAGRHAVLADIITGILLGGQP